MPFLSSGGELSTLPKFRPLGGDPCMLARPKRSRRVRRDERRGATDAVDRAVNFHRTAPMQDVRPNVLA